jgi:hopanoid biosynthesis associated RND transporter like protein HpnN
MHERARDALLGAWGRCVATRPGLTAALCLVLAAAAIVITLRSLEFRADRSDLVDPDLTWNRRYAEYREQFTRWDDLTVCLDGPPDDGRVDALARRIASALVADDRVVAADAGFDVSETGPRLFAAAPEIQFAEVLAEIEQAKPIIAAPNATTALATTLGRMQAAAGAPGSLDRLERVLTAYLDGLAGEAPDFSALRPDAPRWLSLVSELGARRIRFIQVQLAEHGGGVDELGRDLLRVRSLIAREVESSGIDGLEWGVTGIPAIEADETVQSIHDSTVASIAAFVLITVLMLVVFRGVVVPVLAAASLLVGMAWSFGWLVLSVGHLQLLSVVFSVILLGLGVDFALHLVARLELVQDEHADLPSAVSRVFRGIGPGMLTGAITTMAAFGATALTKFKGMAEMGIIAGGGIILCLVAMLSFFPAALALTRRWKQVIRHRPGGETAHFAGGRLDIVDFHPRPTLVVAAIAFGLLALPALRVRYDPNVLNLHPPGIESVEWERRIVEDDARSVWSALVETTAEEAPALVARLRARPEVSGVGAMGLLAPPDLADRQRRIAAVRDAGPAVVPALGGGLEALRRQLGLVQAGLARRAGTETGEAAARLGDLAARSRAALAASAGLDPDEATRRSDAIDAAFETARTALAAWVDDALAPTAPAAADLPAVLREQWTDGDTWLVRVYPAADPLGRSILHPDRLPEFIEGLRHVDEHVFGPPVQIFESSELIKREYVKAAVLAVAAILVLLLLDFRSLADALCAMLPVTIGFVGVFGLMGLVDAPLNFANIIVMPLIFGIGVDAGVHVVHRWRAEPYGRPAGLSGGTGRGITLTMMTTMIGFGCMLMAQHRGIRSLGFVMLAGLGVCLVACYVALPPVLRLRTRHWATGASG